MNQKSKIKCIVTGIQLGISADRFKKLIEKAGGEDELRRTYICRNAKRQLREGKSVDEIRKASGATGLGNIPHDVLQSLAPKAKKTKAKAEPTSEESVEETVIAIPQPEMA